MGTGLAAKVPSARTPTARCPSPKLGGGEGRGGGLKSQRCACHSKPKAPVISSRSHNCHFEPKARNLKFQFPSVLRGEAVETAGFTVLEPIRTASLPCSPPIPSFPPIREKGG